MSLEKYGPGKKPFNQDFAGELILEENRREDKFKPPFYQDFADLWCLWTESYSSLCYL